MKNLAILVDNKNDSTEAQNLLFSMGYKWRGLGEISKSYFYPGMNKYFIFMNKNEMDLQMAGCFAGSSRSYAESRFKEITLPYLRKMANPMKEYLRKNSNGTYSYIGTVQPEHVSDFMIEIPEGAEKATKLGTEIVFWNGDDSFAFDLDDKWSSQPDSMSFNTYVESYGGVEIIWQRPTHPEELPFIDDEPLQSLNDQYAEIEKVRRKTYGFTPERAARISLKTEVAYLDISNTLKQRESTYGSFEDVASVTQDLLSVLKRTGLESLPKPHKEALHMICSKMARIVNGDHNHSDSWHDIAGYATLIDEMLVSEKDMPF